MKNHATPPLKGITVLDLSRLLPGPYCTQTLAQLGASVIKIEDPDGGDYARQLAPDLFELINRGKQSITLDLRQDGDRQHFLRLVESADVVVESFRPGVMKKLGCDYATLNTINPKLIYAAITGYGQTGAYAHKAGHDMNYLATAGVLDQIGHRGGAPALSNVQIADLAGGAMNACIGILAALNGVQQNSQGSFIDISMTDGALAMNTVATASINQHQKSPERGADVLSGALPNYSIYRCKGGGYLAVGSLEPHFFMRVLQGVWDSVPKTLRQPLQRAIAKNTRQPSQSRQPKKSSNSKLPDSITQLLQNPKTAQRLGQPLRWALAAAFKTKTRDQWQQWFEDRDACVSAVLTPLEALQHPLFQQRGLVSQDNHRWQLHCPIQFEQPLPTQSAAPTLGQHNSQLGL